MSSSEISTHQEKRTSSNSSAHTLPGLTIDEKSNQPLEPHLTSPGHGESSFPEDKKEEAIENLEEDWECNPENARNWTLRRKWTAVCIVSFYTFVPPLASSMIAPGLPEIAEKYHITNPTVVALTLSIFLLSFALGPLILAPLSEMYGRTWVLHISNLFSIAFNFGCAFSPNVGALIGFRFLAGLSGSAPIAIGGGSVGDLFAAKDRASAMALYTLGPLLGPIIGPIAGGFIAQSIGVKYVFVVLGGVGSIASVIGIPLLRETYAPIICLRRAKKSMDPEASAKAHPALLKVHENKLQVLWLNLTRPIVLLSTSFICFILSLYMAFMYGIFYLMFSTFATFFSETYGFRPGVGGLTYLGLGMGFFLATAFGAKFADKIYQHLSAKNGGVGKPEMRMPALFFGSFFIPVGLFWYGWSAQARLHWIMPIIGSGIFGFGMMTTFLPITLYLVDSYTFAASATAAASVFRSLLGFAFPLFGQQMANALGLGGSNSLLAGIAIVLGIPFPVWIYYKGEAMRARSDLTR